MPSEMKSTEGCTNTCTGMVSAGIDIGSRTVKIVLSKDGEMIYSSKLENSFDPIGECRKLLDGLSYDSITATGYGRYLFQEHYPEAGTVTEIKAFALGVHQIFPNAKYILDIGGQDTKVISLASDGSIRKFEMNDKCAAGTGRFLEVMSMALRSSLADFGALALSASRIEKINSMCTVFAESEVVSLLARGAVREDVARAICMSVVSRAKTLLGKIGASEEIVFVGGVAYNPAIGKFLSEATGCRVITPEDPQILGAFGASLVHH